VTAVLPAKELVMRLSELFPGSLEEVGPESTLVKADALLDVMAYLKKTGGFDFDYLNFITAADYYSYFEVVYHLTSVNHNQSVFLKVRCYDRDNPVLPSVVSLWQGADFQEREIFDLFGIKFEGHPNLKRILLWDGFPGYPLRKDFIKW
jgi:NADH-quinone oxidoreductase subunit C